MKHKLRSMLLSGALAGAMLMSSPIGTLKAAAESKEPYISEVFIAYGKTEDEAKQWLINNGWEPVDGNFNSGKGSDIASVMGIKRTADPNDAVTDMAVMNMNGGYSFDDYDSVVQQKKAEIDEFIRSFIPVLEEYRANYRGEGSEGGQKRAQYAHDLLNKFYDGKIDGDYAVHDTGKPIGDLLLEQTRLEYGESNHDALPKNEQIQYGDLQQIILESSGAAVETIERSLALATDTAQTTWLDRLEGLSGEALLENIGKYVPEAAGQDLSPSVATTYLNTHFGDTAAVLSEDYFDIQNKLIWYISYNDVNDLWQWEDEPDEDYHARVDAYFENLQASNEEAYENDIEQYGSNGALFEQVYNVSYEGDWGYTLGDFFYPQNGETYDTTEAFLPIAAALSPGQRAGIQFLSLNTLLDSALDSDAVMEAQLTSVDELFEGAESISVYSGINRAIFRKGVALTSEALMQKNMGNNPYDSIWDESGVVSIVAYSGMAIGALTFVATTVIRKGIGYFMRYLKNGIKSAKALRQTVLANSFEKRLADFAEIFGTKRNPTTSYRLLHASRYIAAAGVVLMVLSVALKVAQILKFYNRTFTMIPTMIVDEADIVTYLTDENGNPILDENGQQQKDINFDQFAYYQVVKCNRQEIGINPSAQDGVSDYESWGCGDAADLNCDVGKQWLALYTNKSRDKGDPILADSLLMQYGNDVQPSEYTNCLHYFCYTYAADLADEAYAFSNETNGIYMFWKSDANAFTASTFSKGYIALAAIGGLVAGILGTSVVMVPKRKKNTPDAPVAA